MCQCSPPARSQDILLIIRKALESIISETGLFLCQLTHRMPHVLLHSNTNTMTVETVWLTFHSSQYIHCVFECMATAK